MDEKDKALAEDLNSIRLDNYWLKSLKFLNIRFFEVDLIGLISIPPLLRNFPYTVKSSI